METYLDITKGLHTDFEPIDQPTGTYRYLKNAVRQLSGAIENEKGTRLLNSFIDIDRRIVGSYVLDNDVIIFSCNPISFLSEIGILSANDIYTVVTNDPSLAFNTDTIIRAEGKRNAKGERVIYFTGKGLPMRVLNLDNVPTVDFNDNTKLILTADMPQISLTDVVEGGSLPTGVYQFGVRLLTKSTNATSISLLTNTIPVLDEQVNDRDKYDGASPQTESNKAITLSVSNIDTDYEYLEIIAITYIGIANTIKADVITRLPIQGKSSIDFVYSSTSQIRESLDINALVVDAVSYDSAEFIIQKDGILVLGGLTSSVVDYNFQSAANSINIKYSIKEEVWNENISINNGVDVGVAYAVANDYKNPKTTVEFKSYMRGEVYSFAIVPIFKNWSMGAAYHIPAAIGSLNANVATKQLGTFTSTEDYPLNKDYPIGKVRHHVMPSLIQEPHVQVRNGITYIRMLGVKVDLTTFISSIPSNIKKEIIGYVVVKQRRDDDNKSILAQGIATGHINGTGSTRYKSMPFAQWPAYNSISNLSTDYSMVAFYSPETVITQSSMKSATNIKPVLEFNGVSHRVADARTGDDKFAYVLLNYNNSTGNTSLLNSPRSLDSNFTQYISAGAEVTAQSLGTGVTATPPPSISIAGTNKLLETWRNPGYLYLQISNGQLPTIDTLYGDGKGEVFYKFEDNATDGLYFNNNLGANTGTTSRHLYNVTRNLPRQYGAIYDAKYHYVKHVILSDTFDPIIECFNGDTFITKFSVMSSMNVSATIGPYESFNTNLKGLSYIWVESTVNCGYRHYEASIGNEGDTNYKVGTLPYYPKVKTLYSANAGVQGIFNYSSSLGHPTGYNKQYSFENTIRAYFPPALELEQINTFPNRLIYSEQSVEGEQLDAFRIILANSFHDIPKEKGKITNLFTLANKLYVHTERSLWRTFFNEAVSQISSEGEVYLGNGGVFSRPSSEITTIKGGYAGTTSSSGCTTPFGHFFVDPNQKKVFMFGEELKEISDQGMFKEFKSKISNVPDKPAKQTGYVSVFDYSNKRWILTKIGEWTISYSTQLNSWSSWHDYVPYHYISSGDRVFCSTLHKIYENNVGKHGVYFGAIPASTQLDIVVNDAAHETKTFDNLIFYTTSQKDGREQHYDTFNTLQCYNNTKNTGKCRLRVPRNFADDFVPLNTFECFAKLKSNEFRVAIPSDLVIDVTGDIFDDSNLATTRDFRPRVSGKYMVASLSYNNNRDNNFVLHNIGRLFRQRIR